MHKKLKIFYERCLNKINNPIKHSVGKDNNQTNFPSWGSHMEDWNNILIVEYLRCYKHTIYKYKTIQVCKLKQVFLLQPWCIKCLYTIQI